MPFLGNLIAGIAWVLNSALTIYFWIIIVSALLSWVNPDPYNPIVRMLRNLTQPVYNYIRRYLPFIVIEGIDLSPIVVIFAIEFLRFAVVRNLQYFSLSLLR